jgi:hypothetical protein
MYGMAAGRGIILAALAVVAVALGVAAQGKPIRVAVQANGWDETDKEMITVLVKSIAEQALLESGQYMVLSREIIEAQDNPDALIREQMAKRELIVAEYMCVINIENVKVITIDNVKSGAQILAKIIGAKENRVVAVSEKYTTVDTNPKILGKATNKVITEVLKNRR